MGADERAFAGLDLSFCKPVFVHWIKPLPKESLQQYALRLSEQITEKDPILVGLSFGGIMAVEISKLIPVRKLVLVSSAKTAREIPFYYKWLRYLPLHKMLTTGMLRSGNQLAYRLMGVAGRSDKKAFTRMLEVTDASLLKWSIGQIARWKNTSYPPHTFHIHGTADRMLPCWWVNPDETIRGGEHLMLLSKAKEVSAVLKRVLPER